MSKAERMSSVDTTWRRMDRRWSLWGFLFFTDAQMAPDPEAIIRHFGPQFDSWSTTF
jgi:hypothetical protein